MRGSVVYLVALIFVSAHSIADSLECFSCHNEHNISDCRTTIPCSQDEDCYSEVSGVGNNAVFNLGCMTIQECWATAANTTTSPMASIVGRHVRDGVSSCKQCCSQDYCNRKLCSHSVDHMDGTKESCEDNANFNCELISGAFNVCNNLHQAKTYCRKWCGLCNFTDGGWTDWTPWSGCDVTCSSGYRLRSRSCTNPKPSIGGLDCVGNTTETSECKLDACPVHGNWTTWTSWGICSVSCGVGLERRDRSCSQPIPGPNGHPCVGDAHEDRVCMVKSCADGHWSTWSSWGTCTATCDVGLKVKHRSCDNPTPSLLGRYCEGSSTDFATCNIKDCPHVPTVGPQSVPTSPGGQPLVNTDKPGQLMTTVIPPASCTNSWTPWVNKDSPSSGGGDVESMSPTDLHTFCMHGKISRVECRTTDDIPSYSAGDIMSCTIEGGAVCMNEKDSPYRCSDYKVRYYCQCTVTRSSSTCDTCSPRLVFTQPELSIGYFKLMDNMELCRNLGIVPDIHECSGCCYSKSAYSQMMTDFTNNCNCCQASSHVQKTIKLTCASGRTINKTYDVPTTCGYSPCSGGN